MNLPILERSILEERPHISFSEALSFYKCPHNHWLSYREKIAREDTIYTMFGKAVGEALESKRKHGKDLAWLTLGKKVFRFVLDNEWSEMVKEEDRDWRVWVKAGLRVYHDALEFLDTSYPGWELIDFEFPLYEDIEGSNKKFKGYIDIIFKHDGKIYLFDFKTCSYGWSPDQRKDTHKLYQITLYKEFYCKKTGTDPDLISCAYLLLKRKPAKKAETSVELFEQTSGEVKRKNAVEWLSKQARGIEKGIKIKNKTTCSFCQCGEAESIKKWARKTK
jgi:hypothetical protein